MKVFALVPLLLLAVATSSKVSCFMSSCFHCGIMSLEAKYQRLDHDTHCQYIYDRLVRFNFCSCIRSARVCVMKCLLSPSSCICFVMLFLFYVFTELVFPSFIGSFSLSSEFQFVWLKSFRKYIFPKRS